MSINQKTKKLFSIRLDRDLIEMLDELAKETRFTRSSLVNFILTAVKNNDLEKIKKIKELI